MADKPYEQQSTSSWSANDIVLEDFMAKYIRTQAYFQVCRDNNRLLVKLFDSMREVYRMEKGYMRESSKRIMVAKYDKINKEINNYMNCGDNYKKHNFGRLYNQMDTFFTDLTEEAIAIHFWPTKITERSLDDKLSALRQQ